MEWSKRITYFLALIIVALLPAVVITAAAGYEAALNSYVVGTFSLASISSGFYFWKAKHENIRKYSKTLSKEDIEKVAKCYDAIFKEVNRHE